MLISSAFSRRIYLLNKLTCFPTFFHYYQLLSQSGSFNRSRRPTQVSKWLSKGGMENSFPFQFGLAICYLKSCFRICPFFVNPSRHPIYIFVARPIVRMHRPQGSTPVSLTCFHGHSKNISLFE